MMEKTQSSEIIALLSLLDDPDNEVFSMVSRKILGYGPAVLPELDNYLTFADDPLGQERIEQLIQKIQFQDVQAALKLWALEEQPSLVDGLTIVAQLQYDAFDKESVLDQFEAIRRNVWLEMNNTLSPIEQIDVINGILFNYFRLEGMDPQNNQPKYYAINHLLRHKQGNAFTIGAIYISLCAMLDVPVYAVAMPEHFLLAFFEYYYSFEDEAESRPIAQLNYFIDPVNGLVYNRNDIKMFLRKYGEDDDLTQLVPMSAQSFLALMLENLSEAYYGNNEVEKATAVELLIPLLHRHEND